MIAPTTLGKLDTRRPPIMEQGMEQGTMTIKEARCLTTKTVGHTTMNKTVAKTE